MAVILLGGLSKVSSFLVRRFSSEYCSEEHMRKFRRGKSETRKWIGGVSASPRILYIVLGLHSVKLETYNSSQRRETCLTDSAKIISLCVSDDPPDSTEARGRRFIAFLRRTFPTDRGMTIQHLAVEYHCLPA